MRLFLPFLFLLNLISCAVYTPGTYLAQPQNSLSNIPLRPHTNEVDVYFNNEKPVKPYYRVKMVEVQGDPLLSSDQMLSRLKEQAKHEGIDGLLLTDIGKQANSTTTFPSGEGVVAYQKLVALGVKYKERIDYMDKILKEQIVKLWPDDNPEPKIFSIYFNLNGQLLPLKDAFSDRFFNYEIYPFEDEYTNYKPLPNWEYHLDTLNLYFSKRMLQNTSPAIHSKFQLTGTTIRTAEIKIKKAGSELIEPFELERLYTTAKHVLPSERKLRKRKAKNYEWAEEISYRSDGLPIRTTRYRFINGKKVLYFEIENIYHQSSDLPEPMVNLP